jgi:hypothetical protein
MLTPQTSPKGKEICDNLNVAMEGCQGIIDALDHDVAGLVGHSGSIVSRVKQLFLESTIKDHEERLDSQIAALQLLLTAASWCVLTFQCREEP